MKTSTQEKYDRVVKQGIADLLKPIGFRKRGNSFYLKLDTVTQLVNIQTSSLLAEDRISFTINIGVFVPQHWRYLNGGDSKPLPEHPRDVECLIRRRIGALRGVTDVWYRVDETAVELDLIHENRKNISDFAQPFLARLTSVEQLLESADAVKQSLLNPLEQLIIFGEFGQLDKAKQAYERLCAAVTNMSSLEQTKEIYGRRYRLFE